MIWQMGLLTNKWEQMQLMTDSLKTLNKKVGLRISVDKNKIQKIGNLENDADILLEEAPLENFTYLESNRSNVGDNERCQN